MAERLPEERDLDRPRFPGRSGRRPYVPGRIAIRVRPEAVREAGVADLGRPARAERVLPPALAEPLDRLRRDANLRGVEPLLLRPDRRRQPWTTARQRQAAALFESVPETPGPGLDGILLARVTEGRLTDELLRAAAASPAIDYIERIPTRWPSATGVDPMQNVQWGLRAIRWFEADRPDASAIRVAVVDTGIDTGHPDLAGVDIDYRHDGLAADDHIGHGTHVAGTIAATTNNAEGIAGIAKCVLQAWKVFPDAPTQGDFFVDQARYLRALGELVTGTARVVNLSLGGPASSQTEQLLFNRMAEAGVVAVAAMGNEFEAGNPTSFPAAYENVISVGSVAETKERSPFSNTGPHIDVVAPGSNIMSTLPVRPSEWRTETVYASWSGTSMATPHVAAAVALLLAREPGLGAADVTTRLRDGAADVPAMDGTAFTDEYGAGLLDLVGLLGAAP